MSRRESPKPDDIVLKHMLNNDSANAYGVHKETGKTLSAVQTAFKRLEKAGMIKFVKEVPTVKKGANRRVFSLTLKGFGRAFQLTDVDFIVAHGPRFPQSEEECQILVRFHREMLNSIIRHADLHDIFDEIAIIYTGDKDFTLNYDGWIQIMGSLRTALNGLSSETPLCDLSNPFVLLLGDKAYTDFPHMTFEYLFCRDFVASWRPSEHNLYQRDAKNCFMAALKLILRSELLTEMIYEYMEKEREVLEEGVDLFNNILGNVPRPSDLNIDEHQ